MWWSWWSADGLVCSCGGVVADDISIVKTSSSVTSLIRSISMMWEVPIPEEDGEVTLELLVLAADMALFIFHFRLLGLGMFNR